MTGVQLTELSTIAWIVGTVATFTLLAHWSAGGSWGISSAVASGLIAWAARSPTYAGRWPSDDELDPVRQPEIEPLWATEAGTGAISSQLIDPAVPVAEIEDLGSRPIGR